MSSKRKLLLYTAKLAPNWWAARLHNPFFVIGCGRSGTTILSEWLDCHLDIADLSEANDIWDPLGYPWARSPNGRKSAPLWVDPDAYTARWWADNHERGKEIRAIFGTYQTLKHRRIFVNKTPINTFRIPQLMEMFPDARFIHIVRDGRAVAYSYAQKQHEDIIQNVEIYRQMGFDYSFDDLLLKVALHWRQAVEEVARQDVRLHLRETNRLLEITYEDFCAYTREVLVALTSFMGIASDRFAPPDSRHELKNQNHKWQKALSHEQEQAISAIQEPALKQRGYI